MKAFVFIFILSSFSLGGIQASENRTIDIGFNDDTYKERDREAHKWGQQFCANGKMNLLLDTLPHSYYRCTYTVSDKELDLERIKAQENETCKKEVRSQYKNLVALEDEYLRSCKKVKNIFTNMDCLNTYVAGNSDKLNHLIHNRKVYGVLINYYDFKYRPCSSDMKSGIKKIEDYYSQIIPQEKTSSRIAEYNSSRPTLKDQDVDANSLAKLAGASLQK